MHYFKFNLVLPYRAHLKMLFKVRFIIL